MVSRKQETVDVTIRVDKAHAGRLDEIVGALKAAGLSSSNVTSVS